MDKKGAYLSTIETEHAKIREIIRELNGLLEGKNDVAFLHRPLVELSVLLPRHVDGEDAVFYRELRSEAVIKGQAALLPALDVYMSSMHELTRRVEEFFQRYLGDSIKVEKDREESFVRELSALLDDVIKRMDSEEGSLFHIYRAYFPKD
ncbi:MAG: hemerythrin domain-containing protein [Deltaproteobacteria bacterium]|nr:hemerythrin domain-containing protein [Deltaproteobacteria bacterium]